MTIRGKIGIFVIGVGTTAVAILILKYGVLLLPGGRMQEASQQTRPDNLLQGSHKILHQEVKQTIIEHVGVFDKIPSEGKTLNQFNRLCGVNCLYLINQYYGINCGYADLQHLLAPSDMGISLQRLKDVAESLGYQVEARMVSVETLCHIERPILVLAQMDNNRIQHGHFVVVSRANEGEAFLVYDPPYKKSVIRKSELIKGSGKPVPVLFLSPYGQ